MKYIRLRLSGILLFTITLVTSLNAQQNIAVQYMDKMQKEINAVMVDTWDYISEVAHGKSARKVESKRRDLLRTSKVAMERVSKMGAYDGSYQFRDSVVSFLRINYIVLNEDYGKILNLEEIAEQSYDLMEAYMLAQDLASDKFDSASERMVRAQTLFAASNNISLFASKDKLTTNLEKAGGVIKHYHEVYLIFFKSYKQEAYLIDAMQKKDINAMEQNKNALINSSADGLEKLKNVVAYKNDKSLIYACKDALEFYQSEASTKMGFLIDFYMQQENFNKIKASFDLKKQSARTAEDVKQYNDAVNEFNRSLTSFNRLNDDLNKSRFGVLNHWNSSVIKFLDKHVPKYK